MNSDLFGVICAALGVGFIEFIVGGIILRCIDNISEKRRRRRRWKK